MFVEILQHQAAREQLADALLPTKLARKVLVAIDQNFTHCIWSPDDQDWAACEMQSKVRSMFGSNVIHQRLRAKQKVECMTDERSPQIARHPR
jgi:hypothetical protein